MSLHIDIPIVFGGLLLSTIIPDQEVRIAAFGGIGGLIGGLAGAVLFPVSDKKQLGVRWVVNITIAIIFAPILVWWLLNHYPDLPQALTSLVCGGIVGCVGASVLTIFVPWGLEWLQKFLNAKSNK